jgi:hypothetical protein
MEEIQWPAQQLAPALIMTEELAAKALEIIDESITETEKLLGY